MNNEKSLFKNYLYSVSFQLFSMILPIATVPYLSHVLKPEGVGINAYSSALVSYLVLFGCLGYNFYGQKIVSSSRSKSKELKDIFWELAIGRNIILLILMIGYVIYFAIFYEKDRLIYLLQGLAIVTALTDISFFLNGLEQFKKVVFRNFLVKIVSLIIIFCIVKNSSDIYLFILIMNGSNIAGNMLLIPTLREFSVFRNINIKYLLGLNYKRHIKPSVQLFIPLFSIQIYTIFSKLILGFFTSPVQVGYYDNANKITLLALTILTSFGTVMFPRANYYFSTGNITKVKEYYNQSIQITFLVSIGFVFGIIGISNNFVPWFFGKGFESIKYLLPIMSLTITPISIANVIMTQYLVPSNKNKVYTFSVLCGAIISIILNIILIPLFDVVGSIISYVIAEVMVTIIQLYNSREMLEGKKLKREITQEIIAGFLMLIVVVLLDFFINFNPVIVTIVQIIIGIFIYIGVLRFSKNHSLYFIISKVNLKKIKILE